MTRALRLLGSLALAIPLLVAIGGVLAWGTIYETRFGTPAAQRFIYQSWWFQAVLGFLAVNLALAAFQRWPWQRRHAPFLLAHLGIILILVGGVLGGRLGIEGQLIIPEGEHSETLELPSKLLMIHQPNPGEHHAIPVAFESQAWRRAPNLAIPLGLHRGPARLLVDRYYPDAATATRIAGGGSEDHPAVQLVLTHDGHETTEWLLARDPERFGIRWGPVHALLLEAHDAAHLARLAGRRAPPVAGRGTVTIHLDGAAPATLPVPGAMGRAVPVPGTAYRVTFKQYFPDFVIDESGPASRSDQPNNPAVAFTLSGPAGTDPYLLFALHPEISAMHGWRHAIPAHARYDHPAGERLPPSAIVVVRTPAGTLAAILTGESGEQEYLPSLELGRAYPHAPSGVTFRVAAYEPRAQVHHDVTNRSDRVRAEAIHLVLSNDTEVADTWLGFGGTGELRLGDERLLVSYQKAQRSLPFAVKLIDFRKIEYPGTQMAEAFEADVELTDAPRGVSLRRTISMNNPLKYRGFSLFQASFIDGTPETTVLAVRNDPGVPFVYAGFSIVVLGVILLFRRSSR